MRVLFVSSEVYPLAKTGGLADVSRALPIALKRRGVDVRLLLPGYPGALAQIEEPRPVAKLEPMLGIADVILVAGQLPGTDVPVLLIDAPSLFQRTGGLYQCDNSEDWPDNMLRFAFLSHVAAKVAMGRIGLGWKPDVVHANDWHTGPLPLLLSLEDGPKPSTVFTVHNMAFQGNFPPDVLATTGIPELCFLSGDIEFFGQVSFLKAGLRHGDRVTTVSPTYAREILSPEFGFGMDGLLRERKSDFIGILNGIDDVLWNPATDAYLPRTYRAGDMGGKTACKAALQSEFGLPVCPKIPLVGFVSRIAHQKMADAILSALPWLIEQDAQFVLLGEGDSTLEAEFAKAQARYEHNVSVRIGYDEALAHRLQAGSDILLAPARFEPCGLTQIYAQRYGTLPVVRRTGGLADTVIDANRGAIADRTATGFVFDEPNSAGLVAALDRAIAFYREPLTWRRLQLQAMAQDVSWNASARLYTSLYHDVAGIPLRPREEDLPIGNIAGEAERLVAI
jgi:starch synthase